MNSYELYEDFCENKVLCFSFMNEKEYYQRIKFTLYSLNSIQLFLRVSLSIYIFSRKFRII